MSIVYFRFFGQSGYARAANNYVKSLRLAGFEITDIPIDFAKKKHFSSFSIFHCNPEIAKRMKYSSRDLIFATFETIDPPKAWIKILNKFNRVLVPSKFNQHIFENLLDKPITYIPHCLDLSEFYPSVTPKTQLNNFNFLFLGTWKRRKGYHLLVPAFLNAAKKEKTLRLSIRTSNNKDAYDFCRQFTDKVCVTDNFPFKEDNLITILNYPFKDDEIPSFIKSFDCLISPTLGEGFGLPGLEAMALGVPVITTDYSGCQDYATPDNSWLIKPQGFESIKNMDGLPQFRKCKWPVIQIDQITEKMLEVFDNLLKKNQKVQKGLQTVSREFSLDPVARRWRDILGDR